MKIAYADFIEPKNKILPINITSKDIYSATGGNTGNLIHINSYLSVLKEHEMNHCSLYDTEFINKNDILLITCANQIGNHHIFSNAGIEAIKKIKIPIIACCLGAQNIDTDKLDILDDQHLINIEFFKVIADKRASNYPNISVRGQYSKDVLSFYGINDTTVTGCVSSLLFLNNIGKILKNKYNNKPITNICIAGNNPVNNCVWIDKTLIELVERYHGIHIVQSPAAMFGIVNGEEIEDDIMNELKKIYGMHKNDIMRWFIRYGRVFTNTDHWINVMKLYDLVVGTRYHGVIAGIQAGTIGTLFTIDSRTKELAKTTGIKNIPINMLKNKNYKQIIQMSNWSDEDFTRLDTQTLFCKKQFASFFRNNGIEEIEF